MKPSLLTLGALSLIPFAGAHAQDAASNDAAPNVAVPNVAVPSTASPISAAPGGTTSAPNGYNALVEAAKLIQPGENGSPSATENYAPAENLRRQREAVKRNAPALALARQALALPVTTPLEESQDSSASFAANSSFRELARQFVQESDVRLADGDAVGALASRLDCLEMGVAVSRGPIISMLVGVAIESIGRADMAPIAAKLDAPSCRAAATRLDAIEALRPTLADVLRFEQAQSLRLELSTLPDETALAQLQTPEGRKAAGLSEREAQRALQQTPQPETLRADSARLFNPAIAATRVPYHLAQMVPLPDKLNAITATIRPSLQSPALRFRYEQSVTQNRLLQNAFALRTIKLESGAYPDTYEAGRDPFANGQSLIYRKAGDGYLLYSIGPDNQDDSGRAAKNQRLTLDTETGQTRAVQTRGSGAEAKGDFVAPVF